MRAVWIVARHLGPSPDLVRLCIYGNPNILEKPKYVRLRLCGMLPVGGQRWPMRRDYKLRIELGVSPCYRTRGASKCRAENMNDEMMPTVEVDSIYAKQDDRVLNP